MQNNIVILYSEIYDCQIHLKHTLHIHGYKCWSHQTVKLLLCSNSTPGCVPSASREQNEFYFLFVVRVHMFWGCNVAMCDVQCQQQLVLLQQDVSFNHSRGADLTLSVPCLIVLNYICWVFDNTNQPLEIIICPSSNI